MKRFLEEGLRVSERLGDRRLRADALFGLGIAAIMEGEFERARSLMREVTRIATENGNGNLLVRAANVEANVPLYEGDFEEAERSFNEVLRRARRVEAPEMVTMALRNVGLAVLEQGRLDEAASLFRESLSPGTDPDAPGSAARRGARSYCPRARGRGHRGPSTRRNRAMAPEVGPGTDPFESARNDRTAAAALRALGEDAYRSLAAEGARLALEEATSSRSQSRPTHDSGGCTVDQRRAVAGKGESECLAARSPLVRLRGSERARSVQLPPVIQGVRGHRLAVWRGAGCPRGQQVVGGLRGGRLR